MFANLPFTFLIATPDPTLLASLEPMFLAAGAPVDVVLTLEAAMASINGPEPPTLVLLDETLPAMDPRMNIDRLLASARAQCEESEGAVSIVMIADTVSQGWIDRLAEGVIDDFILRDAEISYWGLRIEMVLRNRQRAHELETFREAAARNAQLDHLTGVYNRETILSMLFRETDRVQRQNGNLSLLLLDIDDFGHWNSRLGNEACDDLLCQVAGRVTRLLRSYDLLGRPGLDEFLLVLPGCSALNGLMLADRIRQEVFAIPFQVGGEAIRLSACFGIASSQGRSPIVVLREAEQALGWARAAGGESIQCFSDSTGAGNLCAGALATSGGESLWTW